jgi:hypothetical protein
MLRSPSNALSPKLSVGWNIFWGWAHSATWASFESRPTRPFSDCWIFLSHVADCGNYFLPLLYIEGGTVSFYFWLWSLPFLHSRSSTILALVPSFAFCSFASRGSFALVTPEMALVKSTAHFVGTAAERQGSWRWRLSRDDGVRTAEWYGIP